jgi:cobalt-zinc-cadmium efflux system outer membrane protein
VTHRHVLVAATFAALLLTTDRGASADGGSPGPPRALSLSDALTRARMHNPDLRAAAQDVEIARGRLVKARYPSRFNPALSGELAHRERNDPDARGSSKDFAVTLSQEVEVAGQRAPRVREAEEGVARAEAELRDRERLLDAAVKRAFFGALVAARRLELQRAIEDLTRRVRDGATARARAGEVPVMEANLAEIRLGQARKDTLTAEAEQSVALIGLRRLLDLAPESAVAPTGRLRGEAPAVTLGPLLERALATRPDLVAATHEVARAGAERTLTRRLAFPNPTLEVFYREEDTGPDRIAGGGITIPLPIFDRRQGELVAVAGRESRARFRTAALRRTIEEEVSEALRRYDAARRTLAVFEQDVLARVDESYGFIETAYRAGKIDLFQLIVVQNDLVQAQLSHLESVARFRDAQVDLERAIGLGLEEVTP